ncbi:hypothetical protein Prum_049210 [Phytohabitans rumicis]|uniref:Uncharacterized protein n=1 Tax=Phytohabitans rumicis TaxID=1076125 RepID=A0A6V8L9N7_9ACTN|nr:hypothetical protein Prum_049210 [Phytohabitans rumicis]
MHVVTARVRRVIHSGPVGNVLCVHQRQRVEIRAKRDHPVAVSDITDHPVPLWEETRRKSSNGKLSSHQGRGFELLVRELRMRVNVTAYGYQFGPREASQRSN